MRGGQYTHTRSPTDQTVYSEARCCGSGKSAGLRGFPSAMGGRLGFRKDAVQRIGIIVRYCEVVSLDGEVVSRK